jgi:nucleotide-binding universal stress UspA family protein
MTVQHILVPLDFSEFSNKALDFALAIAEKFHSQITLFHAVVLFQDDVDEEQRLQEYEEWIKRRERNIHHQMNNSQQKAESRGLKVDSIIKRGVNAADVIVEYLQDHPCDLVIMGTHGRTGLKHLLLGSVAEKVVRLSPIPVMTIHRSLQKFQVSKILTPIDFSIYSKNAADDAIALASHLGSSLEFIHVIEHDIHPSFYAAGIESIFQIDTGLKNRVITNLKEFLADQLNPNIKAEYVVREGKAHKEIVDYAKEAQTDLIVIATHGLTGLDYILLGSTAEKVVRSANCPVLTVKKKL